MSKKAGMKEHLVIVAGLVVLIGSLSGLQSASGQGCFDLKGFKDFGNQSPNDVFVDGGYAFTVDFYGITVLDVNNPANPSKVGELLLPLEARDLAVFGSIAYVADGYSGLQIIDVTVPKNPTILGSCDTPGHAWRVVSSGNAEAV